MQRVLLNHTDLDVSRLCMGSLNFGITLSQDQVCQHLDIFCEAGGNFIDTAHVYSDWLEGTRSRSEKMLGHWLRSVDRKKIILASKGGHFSFDAPEISRVTPEEIRRDISESLDYLNTDYMDLYFLHRDNEAIPVGELVDCLDEQVRAGHMRYVGCSNWTPGRAAEAIEYAKKNNRSPFVVNQLMWSLAKPNKNAFPSDYIMMDEANMAMHEKYQLSAMCFSSQAKGYFARRRAGEVFGQDMLDMYQNIENDRIYDILVSNEDKGTITQQCLRYFIDQPFPTIPIVSCDIPEQLHECMSAFA